MGLRVSALFSNINAMTKSEKTKLRDLLKQITLMQVALLDGDSSVDADEVCRMQREALDLGVDIALTQIFSSSR